MEDAMDVPTLHARIAALEAAMTMLGRMMPLDDCEQWRGAIDNELAKITDGTSRLPLRGARSVHDLATALRMLSDGLALPR
jgi:hypothetical protein